MAFQFSLASLLGELTLIALAIGLVRQAALSQDNRVMAPALLVSSCLMVWAACANMRFMLRSR